MLFRILKLFGLNVPARIAAVQAEIEGRAELAKLRLTRAAKTMSILVLLAVLAAFAGTAAVGVGLTALYSWIALEYSQFYGYAAVGGVLVLVAIVLGLVAFVQANGWSLDSLAPPDEISATSAGASIDETLDDFSSESSSAAGVDKAAEGVAEPPPLRSASWPEGGSPFHALTGMIALPGTGNELVDGLIGGLRDPASHVVDDVLELATDTIRRGEREQLFMTLGMAVFAGWLIEKNAVQARCRPSTGASGVGDTQAPGRTPA